MDWSGFMFNCWVYAPQFLSEKKTLFVNNFGNVEIKVQNNEAYNQSVPKKYNTCANWEKTIDPNIWW